MSNLFEKWKYDVPFIGFSHEDFHYETKDGKTFISEPDMYKENKFYSEFDEWFNEQTGYSFRSEYILDCIESGNVNAVIEYMKVAWELGRKLGYEEYAAFGPEQREYDV